jgi:hypothetical protein
MPTNPSLAAASLLPFVLATTAAAQCFPTWLPGLGIPGFGQFVHAATTWDPDGAGPTPPLAVFGGDFTTAGQWPFAYAAAWQPQSGQFVNLYGLDFRASAFTTLANGDLVAGGAFTGAVASFNGIVWTTLGAGLDAEVRALVRLPNGDLVAGGDFAFGNHVARWDGVAWQPLGTGTDQTVRALAVLPNGDVVAGGDFTIAGGIACSRIARWDGVAWSPVGGGMAGAPNTNISVYTLATLASGDLFAGGAFTTAGGNTVDRLARWNGTTWSAFGSGANASVLASHVAPNGDLLVGGNFTQIAGLAATRVARWNGTNWSTIGTGGPNGSVQSVTTLPGGSVYIGGQFGTVAGVPASFAARWDGIAWSALGSGTDGAVLTTLTTANGDLVVGGMFQLLEGVVAARIARRVGSTWQTLGAGMSTANGSSSVRAVVEMPNGDLVAAGMFTHAGGVAATNIARWNGSVWSPLGGGLPVGVESLVVLPNGDLVAGGMFHTGFGAPADLLAFWNGSTWAPLGANFVAPWYGIVSELAVLPNGDLVAGGAFNAAGSVATNNLARWDGAQWHAFGQPIAATSRVAALTVAANGDLLVGGAFTSIGGVAANYVARFDGTNWAPVGNLQTWTSSTVWCLAELPDGDVIAGGNQLRSFNLNAGLVRWDGTYWLTPWSPAGSVATVMLTPAGDLVAGGAFTTPNQASNFAVLRTPCPATAPAFGAGCTGTGGTNTLAATTLPWTGSTFRARATGLAPNSLAIGVRGLATGSTPLYPLLPQALPGCNLLVSPDLLDLHLPNPFAPGVADIVFPIPDTPTLTGGVLHLQVVPVMFAANGALAEFSASNALTLTIGTW